MKALKTQHGGYTLVETLAATALVALAVGAASVLSLTMSTQEEIMNRVSRGIAYQEAAARLWQMGYEPAEISSLLPPEDTVQSLTFTALTGTFPGPVDMEGVACTAVLLSTPPASGVWDPGEWTGGKGADDVTRTHTMNLYRYDNR